MIIYGAGMAGLIAGKYLKHLDPEIHEVQSSLPNNHGALLRFRSDVVAKATGIPFKKVCVTKAISYGDQLFDRPSIKFSNMYSQKVSLDVMGRSIKNLDAGERYIAPYDFINQLAEDAQIEYESKLTKDFLQQRKESKNPQPVISTIPIDIMMDLVDWKLPDFGYKEITSVWGKIVPVGNKKCDVYQTVYYPDPDLNYYRISVTGDAYIAEYVGKPDSQTAFKDAEHVLWNDFGIIGRVDSVNIKTQKYGKLLPMDDKARKEFILYLTDTYRIYSLGRFATWRQILLDDLVRDLDVISGLIENRDNYKRALLASGKGKI